MSNRGNKPCDQMSSARASKPEIELVQFLVEDIRETAENERLYDGFSASNDDDAKLIADVRENGVLTPLHISEDGYLLDGHRRYNAAVMLSRDAVPCIIEPIQFADLDHGERLKILRSYNHQRDKTFRERVAEARVDIAPEAAYADFMAYEIDRNHIKVDTLDMGEARQRAAITTTAFLEAVLAIIRRYSIRNELPISNRAIHYELLNDPPLTHDRKPKSHYRNEPAFANKLSSLLTRARVAGLIPMDAICDDERPTTVWGVHTDPGVFIAEQQKLFLRGYARDLMRSQPDHIEVVVEKKTKYAATQNIAGRYTIPVTAGKGFASIPPRYQIAERYRRSGKRALILIFLTDFDPDGEQIASSFARSMRDDFNIRDIIPVKASLTHKQVAENDLPSSLEAKVTSPNYKRFVDKYGTRAVELDAMPSELFQQSLITAIESVLDVPAYNYEAEQHRQDCYDIQSIRRAALAAMEDAGEYGAWDE